MKTKKYIHLAFVMIIILSISHIINAQENFITVKGKIRNNVDKKDVVFANVSIEGTGISTVTNIDGEFLIKIKESLKNKNLVFNHIGYNSKIISIKELNKKNNYIYLEPSDIIVKEVKIRPENARTIIESALRQVQLNYSSRAFNAEGFYRETIKKRRDYLTIAEALVDIYKSSYKKLIENDRIKIYKGRKSANVKKSDTLAVKMQGGPKISLLFDIVKNPHILINMTNLYDYNFKLLGIMSIDKRLVYEIAFSPGIQYPEQPMLLGKYYIDVESLAIVSVEFAVDLSNPEKASKLFVKRKPSDVKITPLKAKYIVHYKKINDFYFLDYTRNELKFRCNWKKKLFNSTYTVMSELAITDWDTDLAKKIKYKESFKSNDIFEEKVAAFADDDFWGDHNTIEPDQSIESAIKKYKRKYRKNNK